MILTMNLPNAPPSLDIGGTDDMTLDTLSVEPSTGDGGASEPHWPNSTGTKHNTAFGMHYEDQPELGGVLSDAERSCGSISEITDPDQYVVPMQINVPDLTPINELELPPSCPHPSDIDGQINEKGGSTDITDDITEFTGESRKILARRSLEAGLDASKNLAFDFAVDHFIAGRKLLGLNGWSIEPKTMLDLTSEGANASFRANDLEKMDELINDVLGRELSIEEKFRVYETKMLAEQAAGNYGESVSLGLDVRRQLGLFAPPNKPVSKISFLAMYLRTKHALGKRTSEEIASLPILTGRCEGYL